MDLTDFCGSTLMRNESEHDSPDALTTRLSASAPTLSTRDTSDAFMPQFELPTNREELAPALDTTVDPDWLLHPLGQYPHNDPLPMATSHWENPMASMDIASSPVSAHGAAALQGTVPGGETQHNADIDAATPASTPPFNVSSSLPSGPQGSLEQPCLHVGYAPGPTLWGAPGDAVRFVPARPHMSVNANDGAAGGGGARTEPCTPQSTLGRRPMLVQQRRVVRRRKKEVVDSVKPYWPLTPDSLRKWVDEQDIAVTKNDIKDAIRSMAEIQKEALRDKLKRFPGVMSNSRESSVTRKKDECILFGYEKVLDLLVELLYERKSSLGRGVYSS